MSFRKIQSLSLFTLLMVTIVFSIFMNDAYSQSGSSDILDKMELSPETIISFLESPQKLLEQLSIDFTRDISTIDLLGFSLGMVAYGIFIWHFYRLISRREIVSLHLNKYDTDGRKITSIMVYIIKYVIVFPLVITAWFFVYSLFMFFLAPGIEQDFVFLVVISLVVAIRIAAYYKEDLSRDLAKMVPFALLGIFLVNTSLFTIDQLLARLDNFIPFVGKIATFVLFAIGVEAILRILFLIKRRIIPVAETKVEEEIEKTIDEKMKIKVDQITKKQEKIEDQLEEKIEKTEDKLEDRIEKTEDKMEEKIEKTKNEKKEDTDKKSTQKRS